MSPRTVEMSCERLHMLYLDSRSESVTAPAPLDGPSFAEPSATSLPQRSVEDWLRDLDSQLTDVDVIRVSGAEWLRPEALRSQVEALLQRLSTRGVRIEWSPVGER